MSDTPNRLRCVEGKIVLADGSDSTEYLKQWCAATGTMPDDAINVVRRNSYENIKDIAELMAGWGA